MIASLRNVVTLLSFSCDQGKYVVDLFTKLSRSSKSESESERRIARKLTPISMIFLRPL